MLIFKALAYFMLWQPLRSFRISSYQLYRFGEFWESTLTVALIVGGTLFANYAILLWAVNTRANDRHL